jgi:hypothetical protein
MTQMAVRVAEPLDLGGYSLNKFPALLHGKNHTPWNIHHVNLDRSPMLNRDQAEKLQWLPVHTSSQFSIREYALQNDISGTTSIANTWSRFKQLLSAGLFRRSRTVDVSAQALADVKRSIHELLLRSSGADGSPCQAFWLQEPSLGAYAYMLVGGLRLDLAASTVVMDAAVVCLSQESMSIIAPGIMTMINGSGNIASINTTLAEALAWKRLLPAFTERCRTWTHKSGCNYIPNRVISMFDGIDSDPLCGCGKGVGFTSPQWDVPEWKAILPHATRAAISPLFSVPYVERTIENPPNTPAIPDAKRIFSGAMLSQKRSFTCYPSATQPIARQPQPLHPSHVSNYYSHHVVVLLHRMRTGRFKSVL